MGSRQNADPPIKYKDMISPSPCRTDGSDPERHVRDDSLSSRRHSPTLPSMVKIPLTSPALPRLNHTKRLHRLRWKITVATPLDPRLFRAKGCQYWRQTKRFAKANNVHNGDNITNSNRQWRAVGELCWSFHLRVVHATLVEAPLSGRLVHQHEARNGGNHTLDVDDAF